MDSSTLIRIFAGCVFLCVLAVGIAYLAFLSRLLGKCSPASRTMQPGMVWLQLIPIFGLIWSFLVVSALARTLANEFRLRDIPAPEAEPGKSIGIAMCICSVCAIIPFVNFLALPAELVLWIVYWVKMSNYSRILETPSPWTAAGNTAQSF